MFKKILVPIDLNEPQFSQEALDLAIHEARLNQGEIHLMSVLPGFSSPLVADYFDAETVAEVRESAKAQLKALAAERLPRDVPHSLSIHEGHPAERILHQARQLEADLIVMTAHHRSHLEEVFLGSTSARVADRAPCSVFLLRQRS